MPVIPIQDFDDPRIADFRNMSDADLLRGRGLFVVEGRLAVRRLLSGDFAVVSLLLNASSLRALEGDLARIASNVPVFIVHTGDFASITGFNLHRGCLALVKRPAERSPQDVIGSSGVVLVLEGITDASNVGSAFRNAAAFGAGAVLLSPTCCDPLYRKAIRTSTGSVLTVPYARFDRWPDDLHMLKAHGLTLVALTPSASAIELDAYARQRENRRVALLVGSEGPGLTAGAETIADASVRIPMTASVDSLNLATAAGIALYHLRP